MEATAAAANGANQSLGSGLAVKYAIATPIALEITGAPISSHTLAMSASKNRSIPNAAGTMRTPQASAAQTLISPATSCSTVIKKTLATSVVMVLRFILFYSKNASSSDDSPEGRAPQEQAPTTSNHVPLC